MHFIVETGITCLLLNSLFLSPNIQSIVKCYSFYLLNICHIACFSHSEYHSLVQSLPWISAKIQLAFYPHSPPLPTVHIAIRGSFQKCMNFVTFCLKFRRGSPGLLGYSTKSVPCMTVLFSTYSRLIPCNSPSCDCLLPPSGMSPSSFRSLCSWLLCTFSYALLFSRTLTPSPLLSLHLFISN